MNRRYTPPAIVIPGSAVQKLKRLPLVVKSVEPVQRAYIDIDMAEPLRDELAVESLVEPETGLGPASRVTLTEEGFLKAVDGSAGGACRIAMQSFCRDLVESFGLEPEFRAAVVMLKLPDPEEDRPGVIVLALEKGGRIYTSSFARHRDNVILHDNKTRVIVRVLCYIKPAPSVTTTLRSTRICMKPWESRPRFARGRGLASCLISCRKRSRSGN